MTTATHPSFKTLNRELSKVSQEISRIKEEIEAKSRELSIARAAAKRLNAEIEEVKKRVHVSEHALIRYCERVLNMDFEAIAAEILTPKVRDQIEQLPNVRIPQDGYKLVVKDRVVVTVLGESE